MIAIFKLNLFQRPDFTFSHFFLVVMVVDIVLDMEVDKVAIIVVDIVVGKVANEVSDIVVKISKED